MRGCLGVDQSPVLIEQLLVMKRGRLDEAWWRAHVEGAVTNADLESLRTLYESAVEEWGSDVASRFWWDIMSGFDATAVTG